MRCSDVTSRLTAFVDAELDDATASAVRGHLRTCATCRAAADDELAVRDAVERLPTPDVPPTLWGGIQARLAEREVADSQRSRWWLWWQGARPKMVPIGLVATAAALAVVVWLQRRGDEARPPGAHAPVADKQPVKPPEPPPVPVEDIRLPSAGGCDPTGGDADVATSLARSGTAIDRCYQQAVDDLVALIAEDRPAWSPRRAAAFDAELAAAREVVDAAKPGRPKERAWQALVTLLNRTLTVPMVAEVTP